MNHGVWVFGGRTRTPGLLIVLVLLIALGGCARPAVPAPATAAPVGGAPGVGAPTAGSPATTAPTAAAGGTGAAGAAGGGDPYYPMLGNGGYDVTHYDLVFVVDPPSGVVTATTTIQARTTEQLASFDLDFGQMTVDEVRVNGAAARFESQDNELRITPAAALPANQPFETAVRYHGKPALRPDAATRPVGDMQGWSHNRDGAINVIGEPSGARMWFPANDHPSDKATYRIDVTVPKPWIVAANGERVTQQDEGGATRFVFEMNEPMATYLASVNIDKYQVETLQGPGGLPITNYFPPDYPESSRVHFRQLPAMVDYLDQLFGPYPFALYGALIASSNQSVCLHGGADEVQTLSVHCPGPAMAAEDVIIHELAHQWFGDSVSVKNWQDVWLKEGMATYVEWLWTTRANDAATLDTVVEINSQMYRPRAAVADPSGPQLYREEVYLGGALVYHALRRAVGDEAFFKILRTYLERYRNGNASTADFVAVAEKVAGGGIRAKLEKWLNQVGAPDSAELKTGA